MLPAVLYLLHPCSRLPKGGGLRRMSTLELTITPNPTLFARAMAASPERLEREMSGAISRLVAEMARAARDKAPKATSLLTHSIAARMTGPLEGVVASGVDYARAAEEGTGLWGPHKQASGKLPPVENILDWVKVKHLTPDDPNMDEEDLAFLIARSIAARGTPSQPYFEPMVKEFGARGESLMNAAIERTLETLA